MVQQFQKVGTVPQDAAEGVVRARMPRGKEVVGVIEELLGASRFRVKCSDKNIRICRIPGKFRKRIKLQIGDLVLIEPWAVEPVTKGDVVWIYNKTHAAWLRKKEMI
ncbi:MAG: translation initiation factor eIF-1A [Candidatus Aenigmatarchaeota archaeon]